MHKILYIILLISLQYARPPSASAWRIPFVSASLDEISVGVDTFIQREMIIAVDEVLKDCESDQNEYSCEQRFRGVELWLNRVQSELKVFELSLVPLVVSNRRAEVILTKVRASLVMINDGLTTLEELKGLCFIPCILSWSLLKSHLKDEVKELNDTYQFKPIAPKGLLSQVTRLTLNVGYQMISNHHCTP
jgi:hypothetical protein